MKILAFSDLHRDSKAAKEILHASKMANVVIGAGDFAACGLGASDTVDILREIKVPTIIVAGNHEKVETLQELCQDWPYGHLLHGSSIMIDGQIFFGLGYEVPRRSDAEWNQTLTEDEAESLLDNCPEDAVLITHTPPLGHSDLQRDGTHEGSKSILNTIQTRRIKLHLCGHIHNSWGETSRYNSCPIYNLGPNISWFEV